jgi:peptide/nickel transport system permease protein
MTVESFSAFEKTRSKHWLIDIAVRLVKTKPLGTFGVVVLIIMLVVGICAPLLAPYDYGKVDLASRLQAPSAEHIFGTDQFGRDLFSRIIYGARISMYVGLGAAALSVVGAIIIGLISGYMGGKLDIFIQRFVDAWMCFPGLVIFLTVLSLVGPGLLQVIFVLGISSSIASSRIVRSAVMSVKREVYVQAAIASGSSTPRILITHILPNVMAPVIIMFSLAMGTMIIAEASLSFLGFGIPPPYPSWGGMLSGGARQYMTRAPWMAIWPGLALSIVVYSINMFGDALRDIFDPKLRGGLGRYSGVKNLQKKVLKIEGGIKNSKN